MVSSEPGMMPVHQCEAVGQSHVLTCVAKSWHKDTAPESTPVQPVPCASEPETAKPAQFSAKPQCRYHLRPEKRVAATDYSAGSLPSVVQCSSIQGSTQVARLTDPRQ